MTLTDALETLHTGGTWPELGEAIGVVIESPQSTVYDILHGLRHGGVVAEQAALALYARTGRPIPVNRAELELDFDAWLDWLTLPYSGEWDEQSPEACEPIGAPLSRSILLKTISSGLSREQRIVLILYYFEQMTKAEIGSVLNLPEARVHRIHEDTLRELRSRFTAELAQLMRDLVA